MAVDIPRSQAPSIACHSSRLRPITTKYTMDSSPRFAKHASLQMSLQPSLTPVVGRYMKGIVYALVNDVILRTSFVSIHIILCIEVGDKTVKLNNHTTHPERQQWDFPLTIFPDPNAAAKNAGIIYDLVGFVLVSVGGTHFTARYISHDHKKIYTYDRLKHKGYPVKEQAASRNTSCWP